jgi:hypothetical protein
VANNYLDHARPDMLRLSEKERYERAVSECANGNASACGTRDELAARSASRDAALSRACDGSNPVRCNTLVTEAIAMGNIVMGSNDSFVYANSPDRTFVLNVSTIGPVQTNQAYSNSFQGQQAQNLTESLPVAGLIATPELLLTLGVSKPIIGAAVGGGFDAIGQLTDPNNHDYRYWQTMSNAATGAAVFSLGGGSVVLDGVLGAAANGTNTAVTNAIYGRNDSVLWNASLGGIFGVAGNRVGEWAGKTSAAFVPRVVYPNGFNAEIPVLLQKSVLNPLPSYINTGVSTIVGGIPTFLQGYMPASPLHGGQ